MCDALWTEKHPSNKSITSQVQEHMLLVDLCTVSLQPAEMYFYNHLTER